MMNETNELSVLFGRVLGERKGLLAKPKPKQRTLGMLLSPARATRDCLLPERFDGQVVLFD